MKVSFVDGIDGGRLRVIMFNPLRATAGYFEASYFSDIPGKRECCKIVVVKQRCILKTAFIFVHEMIHYLIWRFLSKKRHFWLHYVNDKMVWS